MGQWNEYLATLCYQFTDEDESFIDILVASGHPSTPGYSDPQYPYMGRQISSE
jgi:aryl-alcohol dehydrogenase (NADP+)